MYIWITISTVRVAKVNYGSDMDIKVVADAVARRYWAVDPIEEGGSVVERLGDEVE